MLSPSEGLATALGDGLSTDMGLGWQAAMQQTTAVLQASLPRGIYTTCHQMVRVSSLIGGV